MLQNDWMRLFIIIFDIGIGCALLMAIVIFAQIRQMNVFWRLAIWAGAVGLIASAQLQIGVLFGKNMSEMEFLGLPVWAFKDLGYWLFTIGLYYFEFNRSRRSV